MTENEITALYREGIRALYRAGKLHSGATGKPVKTKSQAKAAMSAYLKKAKARK